MVNKINLNASCSGIESQDLLWNPPYECCHVRNGLQTCLGLAEARKVRQCSYLGALETSQPTIEVLVESVIIYWLSLPRCLALGLSGVLLYSTFTNIMPELNILTHNTVASVETVWGERMQFH